MLITDPTIPRAYYPASDDRMEITGGTNGTRQISPTDLMSDSLNRAPRPGVIIAGTSPVGTTQDNTGLAFGTNNLTFGSWLRMASWTPGTSRVFFGKLIGGVGLNLYLATTGKLVATIGATDYQSTIATGVADGAWAFIGATLDRSGNLTWWLNGAQLGSPVSIAAASATSLTVSTPMAWGARTDGTLGIVGTMGESWIVTGLLSATDFANIYRAGSIAPFCAYTANSTTGQNVATINGISFYQWLDFGQGYGPIIKDLSGNNQPALIGTTGLTHAVTKNPPGIPQRAPKAAIAVDGSNGSVVRASIGAQNPNTGEVTTWIDLIFPSNSDANNRVITSLTNSTSDSAQGRSFMLRYNSPQGVVSQIYGATTSDTRYLQSVSLDALLAGKRCVIVQRRSSTGIKMFIGLDGEFYDVTSLFQDVTAGTTPPAWTDQVDGSNLIALFRNSGQSNPASIYDVRLANVAMTEAQLRDEYIRGEPGAAWQWGSKAGLITGDSSTFTGGLGSWSAVSGSTVTAPSGAMVISNTASAGYAHGTKDDGFGWTNLMGKVVHMTFTYKLTSGSVTGNWRVGSDNNIQPTLIDGSTPTFVPTASVQMFDAILYVPMVAGGTANLAIRPNSGPETSTIEIDNITIEKVGYTSRLRTDTAAGLSAHDAANKNDFVFSTTGVTTSPNGRRQSFRATTSTSGNQQMLGQQVIAPNSQILFIRARSVTGTPTVTVGTSSGTATVVASVALSTSWKVLTLLATTADAAALSLWVNSNTTDTIQWDVVAEALY